MCISLNDGPLAALAACLPNSTMKCSCFCVAPSDGGRSDGAFLALHIVSFCIVIAMQMFVHMTSRSCLNLLGGLWPDCTAHSGDQNDSSYAVCL